MLVSGGGRIVNVASIIGATGFNGLSVYAASKAALIGFTRSLARELGRANITVNALAPGYMETQMSAGLTDDQVELDPPPHAAAPAGDGGRSGGRGGVPAGAGCGHDHRHGADGGWREHGVSRYEFRLAQAPRTLPRSQAFNARMAAAGQPHRLSAGQPFADAPSPAEGPVTLSRYLCLVDGTVRGGVSVREQTFRLRGEEARIAFYGYPLSEGIINPDFGMVGLDDPQGNHAALSAALRTGRG